MPPLLALALPQPLFREHTQRLYPRQAVVALCYSHSWGNKPTYNGLIPSEPDDELDARHCSKDFTWIN